MSNSVSWQKTQITNILQKASLNKKTRFQILDFQQDPALKLSNELQAFHTIFSQFNKN